MEERSAGTRKRKTRRIVRKLKCGVLRGNFEETTAKVRKNLGGTQVRSARVFCGRLPIKAESVGAERKAVQNVGRPPPIF